MAAIEIWYAPGTIALASVIALEEAGAAYVPRRLDFGGSEQRGDGYLAINPKGRVPALVTPQGVLTETPAILTWIASTHPAAGLLPADPWAAAKLHEVSAYLCSTVHVSHAHMRRGARWTDDPAVAEALKAKVPANMEAHFGFLAGLIRGPWLMGDAYSIVDPYLYTLAEWLPRDGVALDRLPAIAAYVERMRARPAVQRAQAVMA